MMVNRNAFAEWCRFSAAAPAVIRATLSPAGYAGVKNRVTLRAQESRARARHRKRMDVAH